MTAAATRALELDDTLAEAHVALGFSLFYHWDLAGGEREGRRSLELNPDSSDGLSLVTLDLLGQGRFAEALAAGERGVALAPFDYWISFALSVTYLHTQQFHKAIEQLRKTVDIEPGSPIAYGVLAQAYAGAGQRERAIRECEMALALDRKTSMLVLQSAVAYAMVHEAGEARKLAEEIEKNWRHDGVSAFWLASVYSSLHDTETAFEWMEKAYQEHAPFLCYLKSMWTHSRMREDPRFGALLKRVGVA